MSQVNPPPRLRIPRELNQGESRGFFEQLNTILFQLWQRSGGNVDSFDTVGEQISSLDDRVTINENDITFLESKLFVVINTDSNITTNGNQIIICKNTASIDVMLDPLATKGDEVHIKRRDAEVIVRGSIDGVTDKTINVLNYSMNLIFDGTDWSEI